MMDKGLNPSWFQEEHFTHLSSFHEGTFHFPSLSSQGHTSKLLCGSSSSSANGVSEGRTMASSQSHSQAEKRRRARINGHLSTLRRLIPSANQVHGETLGKNYAEAKMRIDKASTSDFQNSPPLDKASLLAKVIDHVKDLKKKTSEIDKCFIIPTEMDEVTVELNHNYPSLRVSLCCDDRPDLFSDLIGVLDDLRLRTVRADVTTIEGRVRNVFILRSNSGEDGVCLSSLRDSLEAVLGRVISSNISSVSTYYTKRQRMLSSSSYSNNST